MGLTLVPLPTRHVRVTRGDLAVHDVAPVGAAEATAVFVPGFTGSKEDFALLAAPLAEAGVRYVAYDQRGQFESHGPDDQAAYTVDALAAELVELLAALGDGPAHVVGHSFGGLVARAAAIAAPEAFASLVLMDSGPAGLAGPQVDAMVALEPVLDTYGPEAVFDAILAQSPVAPDGELAAFLRRRFVGSSVVGLRVMGYEVRHEPDRTAALRASGVRTVVLCGEHDDAWPVDVQRDMAERLGAPCVVVPGALHSPAAERPVETARALLDAWGVA
ncbi:MAG TPA: alpha/beta hydrolase [Mycobacteriales bacterium]|jgi:pimeloyl-ACP methyl ester carboxylesterase|nr:alpha/beta hydrolase [Mycobacteriales bacterium]